MARGPAPFAMRDPEMFAWAEEVLAHAGYAVVSRETGEAIARVERCPALATLAEIEGILYALATTRYAELYPLRVFA